VQGAVQLASKHPALLQQERDLAHKLDSLFAKGLYSVALNVAEADQVRLRSVPQGSALLQSAALRLSICSQVAALKPFLRCHSAVSPACAAWQADSEACQPWARRRLLLNVPLSLQYVPAGR